ncbi:MAG: glycosyltransferase family 39 protein [Candidatus Aminicenantes bacterium]|nr:glycosyltransferase family 39 protein [Candidatus Aminicenantes bacterium]
MLYRELLVFLGVFASAGDFLASPYAQSFVFKTGQILVALLGTLHIAVVWKIGQEFFDQRVAWLAALIVAFHPHLILNGHIFKSDVPLALFFALLLFYALRFVRNLETKDFLAACFIAGLTTACKYNGAVEVLLIPVILWAVRRKLAPKRCWRLLLLSPLFGLFGFLVGAPNWMVHPVKSFLFASRLAFFNFREYTFYGSFSSTYGHYVVDLWRTLGPIFVLLFVIGILFAFLRRNREEMIVVLSLFLYFLVQGSSDYYGTRVILPLYTGVALIIAKGAFRDLFSFLKNPSRQRIFSILVFSFALLFSLGNIKDSLTLFNLWKTSSTLDEAAIFRRDHIPSAFPFGRETFTPREAGDRGYWDIYSIPDFRLFQGSTALPFLTTGILADHILNHSPSKDLKEKLRFRLREYRTFHKISKPRFGAWDGDIIFWYHPHPRILAYTPGSKIYPLPRLISSFQRSTLFFPLQPYEKDPGFFPLEGAFFGKWILSSKPLAALSVTLFCPEGEIEAKVKVNSKGILLRASRGMAEFVFPAPPPLFFQKSPLYRIEIQLPDEHPKAFLLVQERPLVLPSETPHISSPLEGDPPPLFSSEVPPGWVREFYRLTGIDLSLLTLTQEVILWENPERSILPFASEWMVLSRGVYRWEIETEPLAKKVPGSDPPPFEIVCFYGNRLETRTLVWEKLDNGRYATFLENPEERIFLKVNTGDFQKQNLLLLRLRLYPDYLRSIRQGLISRDPSQ